MHSAATGRHYETVWCEQTRLCGGMRRCVYPAFQPVRRPGAAESTTVEAAVIEASGIVLYVMSRWFVPFRLRADGCGRAAGRCCERTFDGVHVIIASAGSVACAEWLEVSNPLVSQAEHPRHLHSAPRGHITVSGAGPSRRGCTAECNGAFTPHFSLRIGLGLVSLSGSKPQ